MTSIETLVVTAFFIGSVHTLLGPDHYLPFVMMSWARKWPHWKTALVTIGCGIGHVASSVVLGFIGVALGLAVERLEGVEAVRGDLAAWFLIAFGLVYAAWGIRRAIRNRPHTHRHLHLDGELHAHEHAHAEEHAHVHDQPDKASLAPWTLFIIFVLGPCEPLIPLLMYPAAQRSVSGLILVTTVFSVTTIATMLVAVFVARTGISFLPVARLQRYTHAIAGGTICLCGCAIVFLGL